MDLYTIGYTGWKVDKFRAALAALGPNLKIYDVRISPYSRNPDYNQKTLMQHHGPAYVHAKGFGNINYRGGPIKLADPEPWYERIARDLAHGPVVLLCICAKLEECHRMVIATEIEKRHNIKTTHLQNIQTPKQETKKLF